MRASVLRTAFLGLLLANLLVWGLFQYRTLEENARREPERLSRQINPDAIRWLPAPGVSGGGASAVADGGSGIAGAAAAMPGTGGADADKAPGEAASQSTDAAGATVTAAAAAGAAASNPSSVPSAGSSGTGEGGAVAGASGASGTSTAAAPVGAQTASSAPASASPVPSNAAAGTTPSQPASRCVEWPALAAADAKALTNRFRSVFPDLQVSTRSEPEADIFLVHLKASATRAEAVQRVAELKRAGVNESYIMQERGPLNHAVSLGMFRTEQAAQNLMTQIRGRGIDGVTLTRRPSSAPAREAVQLRGLSDDMAARLSAFARENRLAAPRDCP